MNGLIAVSMLRLLVLVVVRLLLLLRGLAVHVQRLWLLCMLRYGVV